MSELPRTYGALVAELPPRPVHDDVDLDNATEIIDCLAGFDLNADQEDDLEALSNLVEIYEAEQFPIGDSRIPSAGRALFCSATNTPAVRRPEEIGLPTVTRSVSEEWASCRLASLTLRVTLFLPVAVTCGLLLRHDPKHEQSCRPSPRRAWISLARCG